MIFKRFTLLLKRAILKMKILEYPLSARILAQKNHSIHFYLTFNSVIDESLDYPLHMLPKRKIYIKANVKNE